MEKPSENWKNWDGNTESYSINNSQSPENFKIGNASPEKSEEEKEKQIEERKIFADKKDKEFTDIVEKYFGHIPSLGEASEQSELYKQRQENAFLHFSFHSVEWEKKNNPDADKIYEIWDKLIKELSFLPMVGNKNKPEAIHFDTKKDTIKTLLENNGLRETFKEYKIHLQPRKEYLPLIVDKLAKAIKNDPELREVITRFKVNLQEHSIEQRWQPAMGKPVTEYVPEIVIYPLIGKKNSELALQKIMEIFKNEETEKYGNNLTPRANLKINNLIYFAQGDGTLKRYLSWAQNENELDLLKLRYLTEGNETAIQTLPKPTTLLEDYFDEKYNFALIKGEEPPQFVKDYWKTRLKEGTKLEEVKKEEKPEESQKTPEPTTKTPETEGLTEESKSELNEYFDEVIQWDHAFFDTKEDFEYWRNMVADAFSERYSPEKQEYIKGILGIKLDNISNQIKEKSKELQNKTIDEAVKKSLESDLKTLEEQKKAVYERLKIYYHTPSSEKPPEKPLKNIKTQVYNLIDGARIVFDSKELDPIEKKELLNQYSFQLAKLLNIPLESAYLPELINDDAKLDQLIDKLSTEEGKEKSEESKKTKEELSEKDNKDNQELDKIIKEAMEGQITFESIMKFMTNPEKYMDLLKQRMQDPNFQKNLKNNPDKIKELIDKFNDFINKEKQKSTPEAIKEAAKTIKNEEENGKKSIFQKMGGWHTVGGMARSSLIIFLILIFLGEFKLLEKATGFDLESDKKKK